MSRVIGHSRKYQGLWTQAARLINTQQSSQTNIQRCEVPNAKSS
ncbi:MAG: hypothetical protein ACFKPT_11015 [Gloeotrichia echinulata GP01]